MNTSLFEQYALQKAGAIFRNTDVAVVVGGTGLYVKTFCQGIDDVPVVDEHIRQKINDDFAWEGLAWLQQQVQQHDPLYYSRGEIKNPHRLLRALEVKLSTGRSILEYQTQQKKQRPFRILKIGLELPKDQLHKNINSRVGAMMQAGLLDEVRQLQPHQQLKALQTVGYRELFGHLAGDLSLDDAVEIIKINTRQYAKRQMTWFKKDAEVMWCAPDFEAILQLLKKNAPELVPGL
jgi:tRNA dimethylallyltransferase